MFDSCATGAGRSSDSLMVSIGSSKTYYTQNTPIGPAPTPMYAVTYKAGDGSGNDYVVTDIEEGTAHTLVSFATAGFTAPEGKIFDKWALGSASGTQYAAGASYTVNADTIFVAVYKDILAYPGLCFTANTAGSTVKMSVNGSPIGTDFKTSIDGTTWTTFTPGTTTITLANVGDKVYFKGNNPNGLSTSQSNYYWFDLQQGSVAASGNIMSLIDDGACTTTTIPSEYCFYNLFASNAGLTSAPSLPATTLSKGCYFGMFTRCTSLVVAPNLPATNLSNSCYANMFENCTSLIVSDTSGTG